MLASKLFWFFITCKCNWPNLEDVLNHLISDVNEVQTKVAIHPLSVAVYVYQKRLVKESFFLYKLIVTKRKRFGINQEFNFQCHCFCCFGTPKWPSRRQMKTLCIFCINMIIMHFFVVHRPGSLYRCTVWLSWFMQGFWTIRFPLCVHRQLPTIPGTRLFFQRKNVWQHVSL